VILKVHIDTKEYYFFVENNYIDAVNKCKEIGTKGIVTQVEGNNGRKYYPSHRIKEIELVEEK